MFKACSHYFSQALRLAVCLQLDQSGLSLGSYELYTGNSSAVTRQAFVDFFGTVTRLLGANGTADAYAEDVWQLEKAIAEVILLRIYIYCISLHLCTI